MGQDEQKEGKCASCGHEMAFDELKRRVRFPGLEEADERVAYVYEARLAVERVLETAKDPGEGEVPDPVGSMLTRFLAAMRDDLNTAQGIAELSEPLTVANRLAQSAKGVDKKERLRVLRRFAEDIREVGSVLGVFEREPAEYLLERRDLKASRIGLDVERVEKLVAERAAVRKAKDFARADEIRDELAKLGVEIRDFGGESTWTL
jgi:cysteinyl-tRNA synthetase